MTQVLITTGLLDGLADSIAAKSGEPTPLTIGEMTAAVDAITVPAGTISITSNGTGIDVSAYASADVAVPSAAPNLETVTRSYTPSESAQTETVTPSSGYDGIGEIDVSVSAVDSSYVGSAITRRDSTDISASGATVSVPAGYYGNAASKAVQSGSASMPSSITANGTINGALGNTMSISATATATPQVSAGYVSAGTSSSTAITINAPVTTLNATTYNPQSTDRTISAGTYTIGTQTIKGAPLQNKTVTANGAVSADAGYYGLGTVTVNVSGGGGSLNTQVAQSTTRSTSTSYAEVISLTCDTAGTYDVYWTTFRSSTSGTWGSQLYLGNSAYGSAQTGSWSNHVQNIHLTGVSISANQEVSVRVRSRGSNYYGYVGTLTIVQTA